MIREPVSADFLLLTDFSAKETKAFAESDSRIISIKTPKDKTKSIIRRLLEEVSFSNENRFVTWEFSKRRPKVKIRESTGAKPEAIKAAVKTPKKRARRIFFVQKPTIKTTTGGIKDNPDIQDLAKV